MSPTQRVDAVGSDPGGQALGAGVGDRTLWLLIALAAVGLALAIGFAVWINSAPPLHPVPVASRPSA